MMTNSAKLLKMKGVVSQAKSDITKLEGKQEQLYETLEKEHNCKMVTEAKEKMKKLDNKLDTQEKELTEGVANLENDYNWND